MTTAPSQLIGREREIAEVEAMLAGAADGAGRVVVVSAGAGAGKTALLGAALDRARGAGFTVLTARGIPSERALPFGLVSRLFEPVAPGLVAAGPYPGARPVHGALLGSALGTAPAAPAAPSRTGSSPDALGTELHTLHRALARLAAEHPVLVAVDDLQYLDSPSLRWLSALPQRVDHARIAVVVTVCPGEPCADPAVLDELLAVSAVELHPAALSAAATGELIARVLNAEPEPPFVAAVMREAGGNPLSVTELAAALRDQDIAPTAEAAPLLDGIAVPRLAARLRARLRRMSPHALDVARSAAVLGAEADPERVARLSAVAPAPVREVLTALERAGLVEVTGGAVEFAQPLTRTAVLQHMPFAELAALHAEAAGVLRDGGAPGDRVADQLLAAPAPAAPWAVGVLREAADAALGRGAPDRAAAHLARALREPVQRTVRTRLLAELGHAEGYTDLAAAVDHLSAACSGPAEPVEPTAPPEPSAPAESAQPAAADVSTAPIAPTESAASTAPAAPAPPTERPAPSDQADLSHPSDPSDPSGPEDPSDPFDPTTPEPDAPGAELDLRERTVRELAEFLTVLGRAAEVDEVLEAHKELTSGERALWSADLRYDGEPPPPEAQSTRLRKPRLTGGLDEGRYLSQLATRTARAGRSRSRAAALAEQALAVLPQTPDAVRPRLRAVLVLSHAGRTEEAFERCDAQVRQAERWAHRPCLAGARSLRGVLAHRLGRLPAAAEDTAAGLDLLVGCGAPRHRGPAVELLARRVEVLVDVGDHGEAAALVERSELHGDVPRTWAGTLLLLARGRLRVAAGQPADGLRDLLAGAARLPSWRTDNPAVAPWRADAVRALLMLGEGAEARRHAAEEVEQARQWGTPGPLGVGLRATGAAVGGTEGLAALEKSVAVLERSASGPELARSLAAYGTALGRAKRRVPARRALRSALELAERCGCVELARRARIELSASGGRPPRSSGTAGVAALTAAELRTAVLAAEGRTNKELAQELEVGLRTVEVHLTHAYRKLGIERREQLAAVLHGGPPPGPAAR